MMTQTLFIKEFPEYNGSISTANSPSDTTSSGESPEDDEPDFTDLF